MNIYPSVMGKSQTEINHLFKHLEGVSKYLHLDVEDGKFVPNDSLNFKFRVSSKFNYAAHLMLERPLKWIARNGQRVSVIIFHIESKDKPQDVIDMIRDKGKKVAIALKPETKVKEIEPYLDQLDYVLVMTVDPGFYGAKFKEAPLRKIVQIKKLNSKVEVIVDGGMDPKTIFLAKKAGADGAITGHFVSQAEHPKKAMRELKKALK